MTLPAELATLATMHQLRDRRKLPPFNPSRGGHAPGHLRFRFVELVSYFVQPEGLEGEHEEELFVLTGRLWNCTDTVPQSLRYDLQRLHDDSEATPCTYAQAARFMRRRIVAHNERIIETLKKMIALNDAKELASAQAVVAVDVDDLDSILAAIDEVPSESRPA